MFPFTATGFNDTSGTIDKFSAVVVVDTSGALWIANISTNFEKFWNDPNANANTNALHCKKKFAIFPYPTGE
jgi:hypothetical protein